ncbi:XRE family transcriptional regulator [Pediococcus pentosaceus]
MTGILDKYLEIHGLTRYKLAKESGISQTTWFNVNSRPLDRWTVKQVRVLAECTGVTSSTALQELEELSNKEKR